MIKVSASIVAFNSAKEITTILSCLEKCLPFGLEEVFVVDNMSTDNTKEIISNNFKWVHLIPNEKNLGYGAGHNVALSHISSDVHLIVNPDIKISTEQFAAIVDYFSKNEDIVLACPKVLNEDGTEQYLPKKTPTFKYVILGALPFFKKMRKQYTMADRIIAEPIDVDFCTGCFMMCRTDALLKCGGFDDRFFMYFEDADLSKTMKKYGRVVYNPFLSVTHLWKRENKKSLKGISRFLKSFRKFVKKWKNDK